MWYTLPWPFDEFFHQYIPYKSITKIDIFQIPSQTKTTISQSSLRTLDATGQTWPSPICHLPHVALYDCIETLHMSYYNTHPPRRLSALRNITLVNSIKCLYFGPLFPETVRSIRVLLFYSQPDYRPPDWPIILRSLSTLPQLDSLRIFMYDLPKTIDDRNCEIIAKIAQLLRDFGFCFRHKYKTSNVDDADSVFDDHKKFINQLCYCNLLSFLDKKPYYSIEDDGCGLTMWS